MGNIHYTFAIPVHNGEKYISETIDSILCQSVEKIELFVLDNGSTDKTTEIVKSYDDPRIKLINYDFVDSLSESFNFLSFCSISVISSFASLESPSSC